VGADRVADEASTLVGGVADPLVTELVARPVVGAVGVGQEILDGQGGGADVVREPLQLDWVVGAHAHGGVSWEAAANEGDCGRG